MNFLHYLLELIEVDEQINEGKKHIHFLSKQAQLSHLAYYLLHQIFVLSN